MSRRRSHTGKWDMGLCRICPIPATAENLKVSFELDAGSMKEPMFNEQKPLFIQHIDTLSIFAPDLCQRLLDNEHWKPSEAKAVRKVLARAIFRTTPFANSHLLMPVSLKSEPDPKSLKSRDLLMADFKAVPYLESHNVFDPAINLKWNDSVLTNPTLEQRGPFAFYLGHVENDRGELIIPKLIRMTPLIQRILEGASSPIRIRDLEGKLGIAEDERTDFKALLSKLCQASILLCPIDRGPFDLRPSQKMIRIFQPNADSEANLEVSDKIQQELVQILSLFSSHTPRTTDDSPQDFLEKCRTNWKLHYQDSDVPLLEAFSQEFLNGLEKQSAEVRETRIEHPLLIEGLNPLSLTTLTKEVHLTVEELERKLKQSTGRMNPRTPKIEGTATLVPLQDQDGKVSFMLQSWLDGFPNRLMAHGSSYFSQLHKHQKEHLPRDCKDTVVAQLGFALSSTASNAWSQRPLTKYILALNHIPHRNQTVIPLKDLVVRLRGMEWQLIWRGDGRMVKLINSLLINPEVLSSPVSKFLFALATQSADPLPKSLNVFDDKLPFKPRIRCGNIFIRRASWTLEPRMFLDPHLDLPDWVAVPTKFGFTEFHRQSQDFRSYIESKHQKRIQIFEGLSSIGAPALRIEGKPHHCDISIPFSSTAKRTYTGANRLPTLRLRSKPFSGICSVELHHPTYGGLYEALFRLADQQTYFREFKFPWFYLLFHSPFPHIRLRFLTSPHILNKESARGERLRQRKDQIEETQAIEQIFKLVKDLTKATNGLSFRFLPFEIERDHYLLSEMETYFKCSHLDSLSSLEAVREIGLRPHPVFDDICLVTSRLEQISKILNLADSDLRRNPVPWLRKICKGGLDGQDRLSASETLSIRQLVGSDELLKAVRGSQTKYPIRTPLRRYFVSRLLHMNSRRYPNARPEVFEYMSLDLFRKLCERLDHNI